MMTATACPLSIVGVYVPLLHRVYRRLIEQRHRSQNLHVRHVSVSANRALKDHDALDPRGLRDRRLNRILVVDLLRRGD